IIIMMFVAMGCTPTHSAEIVPMERQNDDPRAPVPTTGVSTISSAAMAITRSICRTHGSAFATKTVEGSHKSMAIVHGTIEGKGHSDRKADESCHRWRRFGLVHSDAAGAMSGGESLCSGQGAGSGGAPEGGVNRCCRSRVRLQLHHPDRVVGRCDKVRPQARPLDSAIPRLPQAADHLHRPEDLLDPLAASLAHREARMTRRSPVDRRAPVRRVLRHVRRHPDALENAGERGRVVALVGTRSSHPGCRGLVPTRWLSACSRSNVPFAGATEMSTHRPLRFSMSTCPKKRS